MRSMSFDLKHGQTMAMLYKIARQSKKQKLRIKVV